VVDLLQTSDAPVVDAPLVIAADSGLDHAFALGIVPQLLVGDLDSASSSALAEARSRGIDLEQHPQDKDATDTELAIDAAVARGCRRVVIVTGGGGRLDHALGGLLLLCQPRYAGLDLSAWWGPAFVRVMHGPSTVSVASRPGEILSLFAMFATASGVTTTGLRYPLLGEDLLPGSTRGVSNVFEASMATVAIERGVLLTVMPERLERDLDDLHDTYAYGGAR
jgi:thiamine pyrophosphokinase